jgi:sugar phosphate isomerase/epimerase
MSTQPTESTHTAPTLASSRRIRLACATVSLPTVSVEAAPTLLRETGITGIEWRVGAHPTAATSSAIPFLVDNQCTLELSEAAARRARALCADADVEIVGLAPYIATGDLDMLKRVLEMACIAETRMVRLQAARPGQGGTYIEARAATRRFLDVAVPLASERGVQLVLELHQETVTPSASSAATLVGDFDPAELGVIYDVGNLILEGYEHHALGLDVLGPHLAHVHLKNATYLPPSERPGVWRPTWAPLDDGVLDVAEFLDLLLAAGYDGWISLEDLSTKRAPVETLRHNAHVLEHAGFVFGV